jgi:predicted RND superfamily exporter protein
VFAIGVSHGAQKMNGIMQDIGRGAHKLVAARYTFRRLFLAGLTALLADAVGFAVLMVIDIPVIQDLALTASIGVAVLILTNLILLPVLLSYVGVSPAAAARSLRNNDLAPKGLNRIWQWLERFTERRWAIGAVLGGALLLAGGVFASFHLKIGDLDAGAPELRADSRYNQDNAYITANYALSSDQFAVIVKTAKEGCLKYQTLVEADRLSWALQQVPGVQTTVALTNAVRQITAGSFEGSPKWLTIARNQDVLNYGAQQASVNNPDLFNTDCSVMPVIAYLADHRAETLDRVVQASAEFAAQHGTPERQFLLAAGSAGIDAATNIVVRQAWTQMLLLVYAAVTVLCFITFRSWRAVVVAVLPLVVTSFLCEALMVWLGIGVKVATLPVVALGVGIGVDYALYLLSVQLAQQRVGVPLREAYRRALQFTGKVVVLVGVTLAAGVITWAFSPIKFQADMGILLAFMFVWNMVGAVILIPALSHFLLPGGLQARPARSSMGIPAAA